MNDSNYNQMRELMVRDQLESRDIVNPQILNAFRKTPRHLFVSEMLKEKSYSDSPLPIGYGQTISQPYVVALMIQLLELSEKEKVLEIGTGCGYQTAILAELAGEVYSVEILAAIHKHAVLNLSQFGYKNIHLFRQNGYAGIPEHSPFGKIILSAAPKEIPAQLIEQLAVNGIMVLPVGDKEQTLLKITKTNKGLLKQNFGSVKFVPMVNE